MGLWSFSIIIPANRCGVVLLGMEMGYGIQINILNKSSTNVFFKWPKGTDIFQE